MAEKKTKPIVLDFSKLQLKSMGGTSLVVKNLNKTVGDNLDLYLSGIRGRRLAEKIYDNEKVELSEEEKIVLISYLNSDSCQLKSFAVKALLTELEK